MQLGQNYWTLYCISEFTCKVLRFSNSDMLLLIKCPSIIYYISVCVCVCI